MLNMPEMFRYMIAGATAFLVDFSLLYLLTKVFSLHYLVSNLFSYSAGLLVVYLINIKWVFNVRKYQNVGLEMLIFSIIAIAGLLLSEFVMWLAVESLSTDILQAKVLATGMVFIFNYVLRKVLLFS